MKNDIINLLFLILLFVGILFLQVYLSKKDNKKLGLILPVISFILSFIPLLSIGVFKAMKTNEILITVLFTFFIANIPTIILLIIYWAFREEKKRRDQLNKMNIQDLE